MRTSLQKNSEPDGLSTKNFRPFSQKRARMRRRYEDGVENFRHMIRWYQPG